MYIFETPMGSLGITNYITPNIINYLEITNGDYNTSNYYINTAGKIIYDTNNPVAQRITFKQQRTTKVNNIEVAYNNNIFQGDEISQARMSRAILVMTDTETIPWVTKDNKVVNLTKVDLLTILKEAGTIQTSIWAQQ